MRERRKAKGVGQKGKGSRLVGKAKDEGGWEMGEKLTNKIRTVRDLKVYRKAFDSAMEIFKLRELKRDGLRNKYEEIR